MKNIILILLLLLVIMATAKVIQTTETVTEIKGTCETKEELIEVIEKYADEAVTFSCMRFNGRNFHYEFMMEYNGSCVRCRIKEDLRIRNE